MQMLIKKGADLNIRDGYNNPALITAIDKGKITGQILNDMSEAVANFAIFSFCNCK